MTYNTRKALPENAELLTDTGEKYVIESVISGGGTSLLYTARYYNNADGEPSERLRAVKEWYPQYSDCRVIRTDEGALQPLGEETDTADFIEKAQRDFRAEAECAAKIGNFIQAFTGADNTIKITGVKLPGREQAPVVFPYQVMLSDSENSISLREYIDELAQKPGNVNGKPHIHELLEMGKKLVSLVKVFHDNGMLHGDIKLSNLRVTTDDQNRHFVVYDLGCAQDLYLADDGKLKTAPLECIPATPGFRAPEAVYHIGPVQLTPAYDLFAAAAVLYYLIKGHYTEEAQAEDRLDKVKYAYLTFSEIRRIGGSRELKTRLEAFFARALAARAEDRFQTAQEMLEELEKLSELSRPLAILKDAKDLELKKAFLRKNILDLANIVSSIYGDIRFEDDRFQTAQKMLDELEQPELSSPVSMGKLKDAKNLELKKAFLRKNILDLANLVSSILYGDIRFEDENM